MMFKARNFYNEFCFMTVSWFSALVSGSSPYLTGYLAVMQIKGKTNQTEKGLCK